MRILLDENEMPYPFNYYHSNANVKVLRERLEALKKSQAKKIVLKLQSIYNLPDEGMFHKKMGEFIKELLECIR